MVKHHNAKIAMREFEEADFNRERYKSRLNVDRIMLERQMTSHDFEKKDSNNNSNRDDDDFIGEVTGEKFDGSDIYDKGMPVRSSFTVRKSHYDDNIHNDFDLYDKIDRNHSEKLTYDDNMDGNNDGGGGYALLDEAMKSITRGTDPYETCISGVNSLTCWMHDNMSTLSREDFIVNGLGLFSIFGTIYLISKGNTELELKNYFDYQDKRHLNAGLLMLREKNNEFRDQIIIDNYIINDKDIPSNMAAAKKLKSLIFNLVVNLSYPEEEADRVNDIIEKISGIDDVISSNTLIKSDISLITVAKLAPIWAYKIDGVIKANFLRRGQTGRQNEQSFIRFVGKTFDYHEDAERQIIEIPMHGDRFVIGIVLPKSDPLNHQSSQGSQGNQNITNLKVLTTSLNFMKPTIMDEVLIPIIDKRYKTRMNATLQKTGLNVVFSEQEMVGLYPEGGSINDCIQYIDVIFGTRSANRKCENRGYRTTRKFIANRCFEYYLRNIENSCIMMMGKYA